MTTEHTCDFEWCDVSWSCATEHWFMEYTNATAWPYSPRVGIGLRYDDGELPAVVIHLDGGRHDADVDTHLRLDEAVALRELLDQVIGYAKSATVKLANDLVADYGDA